MKNFSFLKNSGASTLTFRMWEFTGSAIVNLFILTLLTAYLLPLVYMTVTALKEREQFQLSSAPAYPARQVKFEYEGKSYPVMNVPTDDGFEQWAIVNQARLNSEFIDPDNPEAGLIHWQGNWRQLERVYKPYFAFENFQRAWENTRFALVVQNTLFIAVITSIGTLLASISVAYGFSRFRIPGGKWLFLLVIATILIPQSITLVPTYRFNMEMIAWFRQTFPLESVSWLQTLSAFSGIRLNDSALYFMLPLTLPHFFGNGIFIFLLRQNFKSIPRDLDEAAMLDGAGPLRILVSIILPQSIPVVATVALLHFFYTWNELRLASLYLGTAQHLRTVSLNVQAFQGINFTPELLQAGALLILVVPVIVLFAFQRFFMQDMVVTGMEK